MSNPETATKGYWSLLNNEGLTPEQNTRLGQMRNMLIWTLVSEAMVGPQLYADAMMRVAHEVHVNSEFDLALETVVRTIYGLFPVPGITYDDPPNFYRVIGRPPRG